MRAVVQPRYGSPDVLELREVEPPRPATHEVLLRVRAASLNKVDWHLLTGDPRVIRVHWGLLRPRRGVLGIDAAGVVEAVGEAVTRVRVGDEVLGTNARGGALAELMRVHQDHLAPKPPALSFEEAAAVPTAALTALQGLRDHGRLVRGGRVLVNGASGGVGTFAVQLARILGAGEVTGVCSAAMADLVRSLGADRVLDHAREDFTREEGRHDLVLDLVGDRPLSDCERALSPGGVYVTAAGKPLRFLRLALRGGGRMRSMMARPNPKDLERLCELLESGELRPVVDRVFPLEQAADALRHLEAGRARGKVVVTP